MAILQHGRFECCALALPECRAAGVLPADSAFVYQGRWLAEDGRREADWPCTAVTFDVQASEALHFEMLWSSGPSPFSRFHLTVLGHSWHSSHEIVAWQSSNVALVEIPHAGRFTVELRKVSGSHPFGTGLIGSYLPARWAFHGLNKVPTDVLKLLRPVPLTRRIEFVGSGEVLGCGVDGKERSFILSWLWQVSEQKCQAAYPALVAQELKAAYQMEALLGIGVVQNAYHHVAQHLLGDQTWLHFWPRSMASHGAVGDGGRSFVPQLVVVHLGMDDFNQQGAAGPSNHTFRVVYKKLLHSIIDTYGGLGPGRTRTAILALCGGRSYGGADGDPCLACVQVEDAVRSFHDTLDLHADNAHVQVEYFFLPCSTPSDSALSSLGGLSAAEHQKMASRVVSKIRAMDW